MTRNSAGGALLAALLATTLALAQGEAETRKAPEKIPAGKACLDCHPRPAAHKEVHAPARDGCDACHVQADPALHRFAYPVPEAELCLDCHEDLKLEGNVHEPAGKKDCGACHDPHSSAEPKLLRKGPRETCAACHEATKEPRKAHVHGPFAVGLCQACHDAHASPNENLLRAPARQLCLKCHEHVQPDRGGNDVWHAPVQDDCAACHTAHESDHRFMLVAPPSKLCFECHTETQQRIESAKVKHGALAGERGCAGCHEPHHSPFGQLLRDESMALCLSCHGKELAQGEGRPIANIDRELAERPNHHGPVRERSCEGCHDPHGSDHFRVLKKAYPRTFYAPFDEANYELCFGCHIRDNVLQERSKATEFRDGDRNLHYVHVHKERKGRTCRACHATHASRLPHHLRETTPFGEWELPVGYRLLDDGGTCTSGCHVEKTYRRGPR